MAVRWQIEVYRKQAGVPVDMDAVRAACAEWLDDDQTGDRGYEGEWVYVDGAYVGVAVDAINRLGYTTDEDDLSAETDASFMDRMGM